MIVADQVIAHFPRQVQAPPVVFEHVDDTQALEVVLEAAGNEIVQHALDIFRKDIQPLRRDDHLLLAADDVDLVLGGAESYAFSGDIVAHHEVRSLSCELLAGVGHGVPVRRRESYHKEVGIPLPDGLEYVGRGGKLQARRP